MNAPFATFHPLPDRTELTVARLTAQSLASSIRSCDASVRFHTAAGRDGAAQAADVRARDGREQFWRLLESLLDMSRDEIRELSL